MTVQTLAQQMLDWAQIEVDYRAGVRSLRSIAAANGIGHSSIQWRAKVQGWVREEVGLRGEVQPVTVAVDQVVETPCVVDDAGIDADSRICSALEVQRRQQRDIARLRGLVMKITRALESPLDEMTLLQRIDCAKKLTETQKTLIGLEREAYGIDKKDSDADQAQQTPASLAQMYGQVDGAVDG